MDDATFAARLRLERTRAHLTQEELANRAGITPNAVGALERGEHRHPYPATIRALITALDLSSGEGAALAAAVPARRPRRHAVSSGGSVPAELSPLIGRARELADITALLGRDGVRLVTLTGPGGIGKTSLALTVAAEGRYDFADGVTFVPLVSLRDPGLVLSAIARAVGVSETGTQALGDRLVEVLLDQRLLLVLDNFEHLLDAAPVVTTLLARCPRLVILVTSRAALRVAGEHDVLITPLTVPDLGNLTDPAPAAAATAVQLFVERARAVDPTFTLTPGNAVAVAAICDRLDGLPLAIELAATRIRLFSPETLLPRLERRLPLLTGGRRDAPDRHQTMTDAIAWSYDLLRPDEQRLFRQLAVFVGGSSPCVRRKQAAPVNARACSIVGVSGPAERTDSSHADASA